MSFMGWDDYNEALYPMSHPSSVADTPPAQTSALAASPDPVVPLGVTVSRTLAAVLAGILQTLHSDPTSSPCPDTPMSTGGDFPLAPANSQATGFAPPVGETHSPPLSDTELLVFDVLNLFYTCWFILWDILMKNIVLAQKAANSVYIWVELAPRYHSYLIRSALWLILY
jgi:hypothetical protein